MRTTGTPSRTAGAISHQSQRASKLARNTLDAPTGHGVRGRRCATSRRARPAKGWQRTTSLDPRIAICLRKKVSLSGGNSHQPPRYTCCNQIISQSQGGGHITRSTDLGKGQPLPLLPESPLLWLPTAPENIPELKSTQPRSMTITTTLHTTFAVTRILR